nr:substrate-binding domain-containing protein [Luteimicrobium album]
MRRGLGGRARGSRGGGELPDALLCASDQLAVTVLDVLRDLGVGVPGDVIVTGFDGILAGRVARPALTTVRQPLVEMGRHAARVLVEQIRGVGASSGSRQFDVRLVVRESCGCRAAG